MTKVSALPTLPILLGASKDLPADRFMHELRQTGGVFGREPEVTVVFAGDGAHTDGRTITLPSLAMDGTISERTMRIMRGYLDHEAGHVRHTDMRVWRAYVDACKREGNPVKLGLLNAVEDIWLEQRIIRDYPGARDNLTVTADAVNRDLLERIEAGTVTPADLANPWRIASVAITWAGRTDYGTPTCEALLAMIPKDLAKAVRKWAEKARKSTSTRANTRLADAIYEELVEMAAKARAKAEAEKPKPKPKPTPEPTPEPEPEPEADTPEPDEDASGDTIEGSGGESLRSSRAAEGGDEDHEVEGERREGESDGDGAEGEGDGDGEGEGNRDGDDTGGDDTGADDAGDDAGDPALDGDADVGGRDREPTPKSEPPAPAPEDTPLEGTDFSDAVSRAAKDDGLIPESERVAGTFGHYRPFSTAWDAFHHQSLAGRVLPGRKTARDFVSDELAKSTSPHARGRAKYLEARDRMSSEVGVLRRKLERALLAREARQWDGGMRHGRLDPRRLAAAVSGVDTVFRQRTDAPELNTALQIAVDLSGSMNSGSGGRRIGVAADCVIALAEALARTSISWEVVGFHNRYDMMPGGVTGDGKYAVPHGFSRALPLSLPVFKAFDERLETAAGPIWAIRRWAGDENVDGEALLMMTRRLLARPERRKVLLVLSDGAPACPGDYAGMREHLHTAIAQMEGEGISTAAIGIQSEAVRTYFARAAVVSDLSDLASTALDMLWKQLLGDSDREGRPGAGAGARAAARFL